MTSSESLRHRPALPCPTPLTPPYQHRAGEAELAELALPTRKQEPYRYTDLESLYRTDFATAGASEAAAAAATAAAVAPHLLESCEGQQMVFVNGVFSEELSDVSALGGVEGLVAGHIGAMEGAPLEQVRTVRSQRVALVRRMYVPGMVLFTENFASFLPEFCGSFVTRVCTYRMHLEGACQAGETGQFKHARDWLARRLARRLVLRSTSDEHAYAVSRSLLKYGKTKVPARVEIGQGRVGARDGRAEEFPFTF